MLILDDGFPTKYFESNKMINCVAFRPDLTLHIMKRFVGLKIPDKSTVHNLFHAFTNRACQSNGVITCRILTRFGNKNNNSFSLIRGRVTKQNPDLIANV